MTMPFFMSQEEPDPATLKKLREFQKAEADAKIQWRRTMTGIWSPLFCSCHSYFEHVPGRWVAEECPIHSMFVVTYDGEIL